MFLNKIFNVNNGEWPRVTVAWMMRFLYRAGFVLGWTIIVAMFVSRYGIYSLPYLFAINAFFTILGSFIYSAIIGYVSKEKIMIGTLLTAGIVLFGAAQYAQYNEVLFFLLLIAVEAILMMQFKMLLDAFTEEMFNPLNSERTFPVIESSESIGGILSGVLIITLANSIDTFRFVYLWVALLILIIPCILLYQYIFEKVKILRIKKSERKPFGLVDRIKKELSDSKHISYVKGLIIIVFLQWFLFNLLEFQYTKAVYSNVSDVVLEGGSGFEHAFVHDLGALFVLFSFSALLIQFFIGSRLINYLGVVGSMILHPLVTLFSLFGLTFSFGFSTAVLAKNNFVVTSIIHTNAYHSAYYAIRERFREYAREFLEGIVRPVGALIGTFALILMQIFFVGKDLILYVNLLMLFIVVILFVVEYLQQDKYSETALSDLKKTKDKKVRYNAIDILSQNGHKSSLESLLKILLDKKEDISIRVKILRGLADRQDVKAIDAIIQCLKSKEIHIREAALDTLLSYKVLNRSSKKEVFLQYALMEELKQIYFKESSEKIKSKIMTLLSKFSTVSAVEFLLNVLKKSKGIHKSHAINALGSYDEDSVIEFINPYLKSKNLSHKINAAISLGRFKSFREDAEHTISSFLYSDTPKKISLGLFAVGELKMRRKKKLCVKYLKSTNRNLKMHAAIALIKMNQTEAVPTIIDLLFSGEGKVSTDTRHMLRNIDVRIRKNIDKIVRHIVSEKIEEFPKKSLTKDMLRRLRWLYLLVEEYDEVENLNKIIKK